MARFRYRMQSILDIKLKMETQAKQEFAAAQLRLNEEEERLEALKERKSGYDRQAREQLLGELNCRNMAENKEAILRMDEYIALQRLQVREAETLRMRNGPGARRKVIWIWGLPASVRYGSGRNGSRF